MHTTTRLPQHESRWRVLAGLLFTPTTRVRKYRNLSRRILENTVDELDCRTYCK